MTVNVKLTKTEKRRLRKIKREVQSQFLRMQRAYDSVEKALDKAAKVPAKVSAAAKMTKKEAERTIKQMDRFYARVKKRMKK